MPNETPIEVVAEKRNFRPLIKKALVIAGTAAGFVLAGFALGKTTGHSDGDDGTTVSDDELNELLNIENTEI